MLRVAKGFNRNGHSDRMVLYTGRLAKVKGIETLFEAAKIVRETDPSVRFVLAGPWQMAEAPEAYGLKLNYASSTGVMWIGPQPQEALIDLYKQAALFVMPSHYESFGISVVEAMAFDLPIVAADAGALPEVIGLNDKAVLVSKGDSKALADGIVRTLSSQQNQRAHRGIDDRLLDKYSVATVVASTVKLYEEVSKGRS